MIKATKQNRMLLSLQGFFYVNLAPIVSLLRKSSNSWRYPLKTLMSTSGWMPFTLPSGHSCQITRLMSGLYSP